MKSSRHMPTLILLVLSTVILSTTAYLNRTTTYKDYSLDIRKEPFLTVLMEGLGDRILPWGNSTQTISGENGVISTEISEETAADPQSLELSGDSADSTVDTTTSVEGNVTPSYTLGTVDASYFDDALFIGDSRTVGLHDYATLIHSTYYAKVSSTIYGILDDPIIDIPSEEYHFYGKSTISVRESLSNRHFSKIYIMVGINELGTGTPDTFYTRYKDVIDTLRLLQPDALIFIQSIMHVTTEKSDIDNIYNNMSIDTRNEKIKTLADNQNVFYLDLNTALDDSTGGLNPDYTFDSVHLKASKYILWERFLLENGAVPQ